MLKPPGGAVSPKIATLSSTSSTPVNRDLRWGEVTDDPRIDPVFQYALARAALADDFGWRKLGPIHLLKYAYLADLGYAARHNEETHTRIEWRFHHFGPWSLAAHERIEPAMVGAGAVEKHFSSAYRDDHVRYLLEAEEAERLEITLTAVLPFSVTRAITKAVHEHGSDTAGLLRDVYLTAPMLAARPGEILDFTSAIVSAEPAASPEPQRRLRLTKAERRRRAERIEAGRRRIRQLIAERRSARVAAAGRPPRYDSVFVAGAEALDRQAGDPPRAGSGTLLVDDSVWSSSQRRDPELS